jgi:hypothetical protein
MQLIQPARFRAIDARGCAGSEGRRESLAKAINRIGLRLNSEPIAISEGKVRQIVSLSLDYFSWLAPKSYPMPRIRVVDSPIVVMHESDPSTLVLGRGLRQI